MGARHASDDEPTVAVPHALHLVASGPGPEVRAVLDAVAALHAAMITWAATVDGPVPPHAPPPEALAPDAPVPEAFEPEVLPPPSGSGRHRRQEH